MRPLFSFLIATENPTIEQILAQVKDEVNSDRVDNLIQFCFNKLTEDKALNRSQKQAVFEKLFNLLLKNKSAFTAAKPVNSTYIATLFHTFGKFVADGNKVVIGLLKQNNDLLKDLFIAFAEDPNNTSGKAYSTFFQGLGELKKQGALLINLAASSDAEPEWSDDDDNDDNEVSLETDFWRSRDYQVHIIKILERLCTIAPSAEAIAIVVLGLSRLQVDNWTLDKKKQLDSALVTLIARFLAYETFGARKLNRQEDTKPNAQEVSNLVFALGKLAKSGALIKEKWLEENRREQLYRLIRLINSKNPENMAISVIFYGLGDLALGQCLEKASVYWLVKPIIRYQLLTKPDSETMKAIFIALGRLAERGHILKSDFQGHDKHGDNEALLTKLLDYADFNKQEDIADFFLSLGRLADAQILTKTIWQKYENKFAELIMKFTGNTPVNLVYQRAFFTGMKKIKQIEINTVPTSHEAENFTRSPSASPIIHSDSSFPLRRTILENDDGDEPGPSYDRVVYKK